MFESISWHSTFWRILALFFIVFVLSDLAPHPQLGEGLIEQTFEQILAKKD